MQAYELSLFIRKLQIFWDFFPSLRILHQVYEGVNNSGGKNCFNYMDSLALHDSYPGSHRGSWNYQKHMQCAVGFQAYTFTLGWWSFVPTRISKRFMTKIRPRFCGVPGDIQLLSTETSPFPYPFLSLCTQTHMYTHTHTHLTTALAYIEKSLHRLPSATSEVQTFANITHFSNKILQWTPIETK